MEAGSLRGFDSDSKGSPVSAQLLVPSNQVGCLLGKGGAIISEMRKVTGTGLWIVKGNQMPKYTSEVVDVLQVPYFQCTIGLVSIYTDSFLTREVSFSVYLNQYMYSSTTEIY